MYQDIRPDSAQLDNVVELFARYSVANLPMFKNAKVPSATATLKHTFEVIGTSCNIMRDGWSVARAQCTHAVSCPGQSSRELLPPWLLLQLLR